MLRSESSDQGMLASQLPGTWELVSRVDVTKAGERYPEPARGEEPIALLIYPMIVEVMGVGRSREILSPRNDDFTADCNLRSERPR